ncbi:MULTISPECIES: hypothetical protein [unclassified Streptomyces]|uniref:hypothetical protein n=1 Tax=unclassified Streptomyces TaxID=2593676 RepID=UPI002E2C685F|nr:hypothetical protein [Streptomyces sp. NBC_00223]
MRRGIAAGTAVVLVLEALAIAGVNWVLGLAVRHQEMSLGGLDSDTMAAGSWAGGGLFALFLVVCAVLVARIALRDRTAGRAGRIALIVCAVVQGVVGAIVVGIVGWTAFALLMVILALLVGTLLLYAPEDRAPAALTPTDQ